MISSNSIFQLSIVLINLLSIVLLQSACGLVQVQPKQIVTSKTDEPTAPSSIGKKDVVKLEPKVPNKSNEGSLKGKVFLVWLTSGTGTGWTEIPSGSPVYLCDQKKLDSDSDFLRRVSDIPGFTFNSRANAAAEAVRASLVASTLVSKEGHFAFDHIREGSYYVVIFELNPQHTAQGCWLEKVRIKHDSLCLLECENATLQNFCSVGEPPNPAFH